MIFGKSVYPLPFQFPIFSLTILFSELLYVEDVYLNLVSTTEGRLGVRGIPVVVFFSDDIRREPVDFLDSSKDVLGIVHG